MSRNLSLLLVPFFFTLIFNIVFDFLNLEKNKELSSIIKVYTAPIAVHKNFQFINHSNDFVNHKDKIQTITLV